MIAITGANGQLGRLVIAALLRKLPPSEIVAAVRRPAAAADLAELGVVVREADYDRPETLVAAFRGVDRLLLISSSEVGKRAAQHRAAIAAAKEAGVGLVAYTSILRADRSPLMLAAEHRETEAALAEAGIPHVLLRHGWYTENLTGGIAAALERGVILGGSGEGRFASAARADYAEADAAVLLAEDQAGRVHELAGDAGYTRSEFAAELARQSGPPVAYRDLPPAALKAAFIDAGLPEGYAAVLVDSELGASNGALDDRSGALGRLIGRPTTPLAASIAAALAA